MRDLNFFENYVEKKEFRIDKKLVYISLSIFIFLSFLTYSFYNHMIIKEETKIVASLKSIAEDTKTLKKVEEIQEKEVEVQEFRDSVEKISKLDSIIESKDIISESLLNNITITMPDGVFLTSIGVNNSDIQLVGVAKDKWSIAEFEKGLENLDKVEDIFISNISLQENYYNFNVNITMEDVNIDGEESKEI